MVLSSSFCRSRLGSRHFSVLQHRSLEVLHRPAELGGASLSAFGLEDRGITSSVSGAAAVIWKRLKRRGGWRRLLT